MFLSFSCEWRSSVVQARMCKLGRDPLIFLKILVVIGHVCIYWSKVAEGFSVFNAVLYLFPGLPCPIGWYVKKTPPPPLLPKRDHIYHTHVITSKQFQSNLDAVKCQTQVKKIILYLVLTKPTTIFIRIFWVGWGSHIHCWGWDTPLLCIYGTHYFQYRASWWYGL